MVKVLPRTVVSEGSMGATGSVPKLAPHMAVGWRPQFLTMCISP